MYGVLLPGKLKGDDEYWKHYHFSFAFVHTLANGIGFGVGVKEADPLLSCFSRWILWCSIFYIGTSWDKFPQVEKKSYVSSSGICFRDFNVMSVILARPLSSSSSSSSHVRDTCA